MSFTTQTPLEKGVLEGVTEPTLKKLHEVGITTLEALLVTPPRTLIELTDMTLETAERCIDRARRLIDQGFITAEKLHELTKDRPRLTTGSKELDRILGGGIETGAITELIGEYAGGKTQLCFTLAVFATRPQAEGGLDGKVAFIDTENTFKTSRLIQVSDGRGFSRSDTLQRIFVTPAFTSKHLLTLVQRLHGLCQSENIRLIIVDSLLSHFRSEYIGREMLAERQQTMASVLGHLLRLAQAHNLAIVITNQLQAIPTVVYGNPNRPGGGHVMAHASTHRLLLTKGRNNTRLAEIIDSSYLPNEKIRLRITEKGIEDVEGEPSTVGGK